jgi:CHAD domain-containing protein
VEHEIKLIAPVDFQLPDPDGIVAGLSAGPFSHLELDATYFDTDELAMARSGITVRYRTGETGRPWTVKLPQRANGSALTRRELRFDGDPDTVPDAAADLVRAHVRSHRLRPVLRLHTQRTVVPLLDIEGDPVAELADDLVTAYNGPTQTGTFREVEVEFTQHAQHANHLQRAAIAWLTAAGCRLDTPLPKLTRALGQRATAPPEVTIVPLDAEPTVVELIRHSISASTDRLIRHDAGVRLGDDPEDVHQVRVAARTLRSNLKTFAPQLAHEWNQQLRADLRWVGAEAGGVRDLDVLGHRLRRRIADLRSEDSAAAAILLAQLTARRDAARTRMLTALRSERYDRLLDSLVFASRTPSLDPDASTDTPARAFVRSAAHTQVRRLARSIAAVGEPATDTDLHLIRIQAKRTRYAIEAARPVIGHPAAEHAAALARLQDVLGDLHDSIVAVHWLRDAAAAQPACALGAGQLIAAEYVDQASLRNLVYPALHAATAKHLRHWL